MKARFKKIAKKPATVGPTSRSNRCKCLFCDSSSTGVAEEVLQNSFFLVVEGEEEEGGGGEEKR